jgi:hypothetical protein
METGYTGLQIKRRLSDIATSRGQNRSAISMDARSYRWICAREDVDNIEEGRAILKKQIVDYNSKRVHLITMEIPDIRFRNAVKTVKHYSENSNWSRHSNPPKIFSVCGQLRRLTFIGKFFLRSWKSRY